ncbi:putative Holliday junction resolvase [Metamycoplasma cloacale]|uniref:Putative pre-16S rRNA nuclease n=1 Tax=Metamycoplasma cloacale TaxID=92401 RepID=A0A2Z4LM19_9BACT|nr:Holliday junction resolvase RuvX [Metamycoplasma cloacale]AWX42744.1 Holliday junction resolvase RuvX [Metamycoplasma cloacale]VEU79441.1 putative Holliday junction resolvase [Metamycoplasma cloacale]
MRKLCLDLGTKSCGFAISDPLCIIATGLENYRFEENRFDLVIQRVKYYLNLTDYKNSIDTIILGYPVRMDLSKSERTYMVEKFAEMLKTEINLPIYFQDERQTTRNAEDILISAGFSRKKRKTKKDSLAAQLILEDYLRRYHG